MFLYNTLRLQIICILNIYNLQSAKQGGLSNLLDILFLNIHSVCNKNLHCLLSNR